MNIPSDKNQKGNRPKRRWWLIAIGLYLMLSSLAPGEAIGGDLTGFWIATLLLLMGGACLVYLGWRGPRQNKNNRCKEAGKK